MRFDEFFRLHEHAAGAAAGVVHLAVVRRQHGHQCLDDGGRGVELAALLAFGAGELAEEIFVDLAQHVARLAGILAEANGGNQIHQLAQLAIRQLGARVALVQNALELGVFALDFGQGVIHLFADIGLLGRGAQVLPAGRLRHPEDIHRRVVVAVVQLFRQQLIIAIVQEVFVVLVGEALFQFGLTGGEGVGDVLEEDKAKNEVLVFGGVHIGAQLVCRGPEGLLDIVKHGYGYFRSKIAGTRGACPHPHSIARYFTLYGILAGDGMQGWRLGASR